MKLQDQEVISVICREFSQIMHKKTKIELYQRRQKKITCTKNKIKRKYHFMKMEVKLILMYKNEKKKQKCMCRFPK